MSESKWAHVHRCPSEGEAVTPCCGKTPFELPYYDRITLHDDLVTCRPASGGRAVACWHLETPIGFDKALDEVIAAGAPGYARNERRRHAMSERRA